MKPRGLERDAMLKDLSKPAQHRRMPAHYLYQEEAFSARRKEFWPLMEAKSLLDHFIPTKVCHESDGLILQPYEGPKSEYIPHTCDEVLKWKFAHLNSVDFRLRFKGSGDQEGKFHSALLHWSTCSKAGMSIARLQRRLLVFRPVHIDYAHASSRPLKACVCLTHEGDVLTCLHNSQLINGILNSQLL